MTKTTIRAKKKAKMSVGRTFIVFEVNDAQIRQVGIIRGNEGQDANAKVVA